MTQVLDYYAVQSRAVLACFKAGGADGIAHYLTASMSDPREINRQELEDSLSLGLAVHLVYEMNPTYPGYFTFAQGAEDCRQAQARLAELGAPDGTVVYFTVDVNIDPNIVVPYFNGVESVETPAIVPGGYGYQRFCEFAYENFPKVGKHLWQTYGIPVVPTDMWQHLQEDRCGVEVDVNECSAPGWRREEDMPINKDELVAALNDDPNVVQKVNTFIAIKEALALLAAHQREAATPNLGDLAAGITARVEANLSKVLSGLVPPVPPSCPSGTKYFGESADGSAVGWTYPDGTTHYFVDGKEVAK